MVGMVCAGGMMGMFGMVGSMSMLGKVGMVGMLGMEGWDRGCILLYSTALYLLNYTLFNSNILYCTIVAEPVSATRFYLTVSL